MFTKSFCFVYFLLKLSVRLEEIRVEPNLTEWALDRKVPLRGHSNRVMNNEPSPGLSPNRLSLAD